jgi:O-antigen ligase
MQAPVWYLIAKVSDLVGGTGWHRSYLIDQAVGHFNEWWLIGSSYTAHWAPAGEVLTVDPNNMDITNQYIAQGLHGGVLGLGLFIALIVTCFKAIGRFVRSGEGTLPRGKLAWALGVGLAAHCTAFISISYFDQSIMFLFWLWAAIATIPEWEAQAANLGRVPEPEENNRETCSATWTLAK